MTRRIPLIDVALEAGATIVLPAETTHYLRDVLRMSAGAVVEVFDGAGSLALAELGATESGPLEATILEVSQAPEPSPSITLFTAIPKGDRWNYLLEKSTEVGVAHIQPVLTSRSVVKPSADRVVKQLKRWKKIVAGAARQSLRAHIPSVEKPIRFEESLSLEFDSKRIASPLAGPESRALHSPETIGIWIGPEGGFTAQELELAEQNDVTPLGLSDHVLRVETAAVVAVALLKLELP